MWWYVVSHSLSYIHSHACIYERIFFLSYQHLSYLYCYIHGRQDLGILLILCNIILSPLLFSLSSVQPDVCNSSAARQVSLFATKISPFQCERARVPPCMQQHGRSRHWQHCNTVCNAESDSFAKVIRIFIDCVGSYRVEQELEQKCACFMDACGGFTQGCKGRCNPPAPEGMLLRESPLGQVEFSSQLDRSLQHALLSLWLHSLFVK